MLGRGFIFLTNLLLPLPLVHKMAVVGDNGEIRGYLRVAVQPILDNKRHSDGAWNNTSIQYTSRRESATTYVKFNGVAEDKDSASLCESIPEDVDVRVVEGRGDSSAENSVSESFPKEVKSVDADDSGAFCDPDPVNIEESTQRCESFATKCVKNQLEVGSELQFRITILDAVGISPKYADIFCQFNFLYRNEEAFSTEPLKNTGKGAPLGFYHVQNICVEVTQQFIDYVINQPIVFEVYGHYTHHPLHDDSKELALDLSPQLPPTTTLAPLSKPVPASNAIGDELMNGAMGNHIQCTYDVMLWVEICELQPQGDYTPVTVEHQGDISNNSGEFLLHQGIQRRIVFTLVHEHGPELAWRDVKEVVVGNIRSKRSVDASHHSTDHILSLSLFPGHYVYPAIDDRTFFRFECSWDSSLHNSILLNRVTPSGEKVFVTLSIYLELDNCCQPVVISKDVSLLVCNRDAKLNTSRSLRSFFTGSYRSADSNRVTGVYELSLKHNYTGVRGSPGMRRRRRRVIDTSSTYVRGEENLAGWRPRGDSLILEHQNELERFQKVFQVEKTRHILLLQNTMRTDSPHHVTGRSYEPLGCESNQEGMKQSDKLRHLPPEDHPSAQTSSRKDQLNPAICFHELDAQSTVKFDCTPFKNPNNVTATNNAEATLREKRLKEKCLRLMQHRTPSIFDIQDMNQIHDTDPDARTHDMDSSSCSQSQPIVQSNSIIFNDQLKDNLGLRPHVGALELHVDGISPRPSPTCSGVTTPDSSWFEMEWARNRYVPSVAEVRVSPVVSRRGYLNVLEPGATCWMKRWLVVRRPYVFIYNSHKDPVERGMFNLSTTMVEYSRDNSPQINTPYTFAVCTQHRGFVLQAATESEMHGWLYAFNPLLAGSISRSKLARRTNNIET